jgi:hypothetical protein
MQPMQRWLVTRGGAVTLAALAVYVALAPQHVVDGDNAEFATVGTIGGRPHPSGYPLYVLYLRAMSWLPGASPAHTAALATALLAALTVLVLHAACRAWGARPAAASVTAAIYAASPVVLRMHTEAEVFALNALIVSLVLWLSAVADVRGVRRAAALGLVAGLGLGNHVTCALVAPIGLLGVVRAAREVERGKLLAVGAAITGLALGLCSYGYLFVADGPASFGRVDSGSDLLAFFLRKDYGGPGSFLPGGAPPSIGANLLALAQTLGRGWLWLPALLGIGFLGYRCVTPRQSRAPWIALGLSWLVAGPVLALRFNVVPEGLGLYVCQRFHLLPLLLLAPAVAVGFDHVGDRIASHVGPRARSQSALLGLAIVALLGGVASSLAWLRGVHSPAMEIGVRNMLRSVPPSSIIIVNSDELCFAAEYLRHARGERSDVDVVCWTLTTRDWYADRLSAHGIELRSGGEPQLSKGQAETLLATGRPVFVDGWQKQVAAQLASYPHGVLIRLLPARDKMPSLAEVVEINRQLYAAFDLDYPRPRRDHDYAAVAHKRYAATWLMLSNALEQAGDKQGARVTHTSSPTSSRRRRSSHSTRRHQRPRTPLSSNNIVRS